MDFLELIGLKQKIVSPLPDNNINGFVSPISQQQLQENIARQKYQEEQQKLQMAQQALAKQNQFGIGQEEVQVEPNLFDVLRALDASDEERRNVAELTGRESGYGYNLNPNINNREQSYGPVQINLAAGRIDPNTGQPFTQAGAEDIKNAIQYALDEYRRTKGLGNWNPGAYNLYQNELPEIAKTKKYKKGK